MKGEGLNQLLDRVVGRLAHDLRNPLAVVVSNLRYLADQLDDPDLSEAAAESVIASDRLTGMIEDAASLEMLRSGRLRPTFADVRLPELRAEVDRLIAPMLGSRKLCWEIGPCVVSLDGRLLQRILIALVDHAVRRSPPGATISVSMCCQVGGLELQVSDQGPPFAPGHVPSIQSEEVPAEPSPTSASFRNDEGLSLYFAGVAARALGATVSMRERDDPPGAVFLLSFPARTHSGA